MASSRRTRRRGRGGQTRADGGADDATLSKVLARILRHSTQELGKLQELLNEGHSLGPKASTSVPMASSRSTTSSAPPRFAPSTGSHIVASEFFSVLMRMLTPAQLAAGHTTAEMVAAVVRADPSRFELTERNGSALVRATYGHSLPVPQLDAQLAPNVPPADAVLIAAPASLPVVRVKHAADTDPPSAWATLPIDVIGLIMAHHTHVTKLRAASCDNAIALFPSLRSLALWRPVAGLSLPAGLTELVMGCRANLLGVASVPPLRSLKLSLYCNFFALEPLLTSVRSSLTALDLDGFIDDGKGTTVAEYEDYFRNPAARLSSLTSLRVIWPAITHAHLVLDILRLHKAQLRSLMVIGKALARPIFADAGVCPELHTLSLHYEEYQPAPLAAFVNSCKSLTDLTALVGKLNQRSRTSLRHLGVRHIAMQDTVAEMLSLISLLPNLRTLNHGAPHDFPERARHAVHGMWRRDSTHHAIDRLITQLSVSSAVQPCIIKEALINPRVERFMIAGNDVALRLPTVRLPSLRTLVIRDMRTDEAAVQDFVTRVLAGSPRLKRVCLLNVRFADADGRPAPGSMTRVLRFLDCTGLREVHFNFEITDNQWVIPRLRWTRPVLG